MDKNILEKLYAMYSREIYLYLFSFCHSHTLAEDLMQETFLKAILSLPDEHTNMRAWLYMVARNLFYNHRKKHGQEVSYDQAIDLSGGDDLMNRILKDERTQHLYRALAQLEERKREVLLLQYFSGLSQKQIASVLHISPENVRILAYRGKKEIKQWMEGNGYDIS